MALPLKAAHRDALRWSMCFVVALAAHAVIAMSFVRKPSSHNDGVDAPVIMLDLPETFVNSVSPPTDLPPGPRREESEATPAPKEDTKPPEPQADVALQEPQPPKPEPPQEATAPPPEAPSIAVIHRWETELVAHIEHFKHYPTRARIRGVQGLARVRFTIDRDGRVRESRILQSSGSTELDEEALAVLTRAQPMPLPPSHATKDEFSFTVPLRFGFD